MRNAFLLEVSGSGRECVFLCGDWNRFLRTDISGAPTTQECEEASHSCAEIKSLLDFLRTGEARTVDADRVVVAIEG